MFLRYNLTRSQHWFRQYPGVIYTTNGYTTWTNGVHQRCQVQWVKGYLQSCYVNLFLRYNLTRSQHWFKQYPGVIHMIDGYTTWTNGVQWRCQVQWVKGYLQPCYVNLFLRYNWQKVNIGSESIPASYTWSSGIPPGPMVFTKGVKYNESKGIFNHAISTCFLGIIDKRSTLVQRVSRRHTHDRRVYYLDQWCSLKVSSAMSWRVSTSMIYQLVT